MKHIKAISCLLLSSMVLTAFFGCDGSREESGVSDAMSGTCSVVSEAVSDVSAEESHGSSEEISMESFGEESGVMSGAEESSVGEASKEESSEEEYSDVDISEYVENIADYEFFHYGEEGNGYYSISGYHGTDPYIILPTEYNGEPVTGIGHQDNYIFSFNTYIKGVIIPACYTGGEWGIFTGCTSLESVVFLGEKFEFGLYTFSSCTGMKNLVLPEKQETLPRNCLPSGSKLKTLRLPDTYMGPEPMFLPNDITYIVKRGSTAEETLINYNKQDWVIQSETAAKKYISVD